MQLYGLNKLTLLDYPGHLACTVFTGACNFRCPFCHNAPLVLFQDRCATLTEDDVFSFLKKRRSTLEGVCVTGGEPTLQKDLPQFLANIKELGFLVKLDTNGYAPELLEQLLQAGLVDMVAMDIKNSPDRYARTIGLSDSQFDLSRILASVELLRSSKLCYEFRTTVVKELHPVECFDEIGAWLAGPSPYYLQQFVAGDQMICNDTDCFHAYTGEELFMLCRRLSSYLPNTSIRGTE